MAENYDLAFPGRNTYYKLVNCINDEVIYTDTVGCPRCAANVGDLVYTNLEPVSCWYILISDIIPSILTPISIYYELPCNVCLPQCYTITGTGTVSYVVLADTYIVETSPLPAIICSNSYPTVSGLNNEIFVGDECNLITGCPNYCYNLTNCVTGEILISTNQELAFPFVLNETVEIAERDGCWTITRNGEECDGEVETTVINTYATCEDCVPVFYYRLESCGNSEPIILYTSQDLSAYVGQTITLDDYIGCYNVTIYEGQVPSPVTIVFKNNYPDCIECATPRYKLTDCDGIRPSIFTTTNLSGYLSSVIKLTFYPDTCWTVEETTINSSDDLVIISTEFADCQECSLDYPCLCCTVTNNSEFTQTFTYRDCDGNTEGNDIILEPGEVSDKHCVLKWLFPEPWSLPKIITDYGECVDGKCPVILIFRGVRPGYNSPSCSIQYYERITCAYAEILYRDVIAQRYGITPCCSEEEIYRLDIKFQLLELQAINNPDYLCAPFNPCCQRDIDCGCGCNS